MKIIYWVVSRNNSNINHFSVTGEGSIEEECYVDAINKVNEMVPFQKNVQLQKITTI
jgi:hypothetical protein